MRWRQSQGPKPLTRTVTLRSNGFRLDVGWGPQGMTSFVAFGGPKTLRQGTTPMVNLGSQTASTFSLCGTQWLLNPCLRVIRNPPTSVNMRPFEGLFSRSLAGTGLPHPSGSMRTNCHKSPLLSSWTSRCTWRAQTLKKKTRP